MNDVKLTVKIVKYESKAELVLEGRLDSITTQDAEPVFMKYAEEYPRLVLNLEDMEYISSAGLRLIKKLHITMKKKDGELTIKNVNRLVMEVFEMTGFVALFKFE